MSACLAATSGAIEDAPCFYRLAVGSDPPTARTLKDDFSSISFDDFDVTTESSFNQNRVPNANIVHYECASVGDGIGCEDIVNKYQCFSGPYEGSLEPLENKCFYDELQVPNPDEDDADEGCKSRDLINDCGQLRSESLCLVPSFFPNLDKYCFWSSESNTCEYV
jgi:hypothetical protein